MSLELTFAASLAGIVRRRGHRGVVDAEASCAGRIKHNSVLVGRGGRVKVRDEGGYLKFKLATPYSREQLNAETRRLEADRQ